LESYYIDHGDTIVAQIQLFQSKSSLIFPERVIQNSTDLANNYLMIDKGTRDGVSKNMGVICPQGIVGIIVNASENFCIAMSVFEQ
jgi:cell shape-determining protein MreC